MRGISAQSLENKIRVLKQERQQLAKQHSKFYDIRERFKREIDRKAAEMRRSGSPVGKAGRSGEYTVILTCHLLKAGGVSGISNKSFLRHFKIRKYFNKPCRSRSISHFFVDMYPLKVFPYCVIFN